jgi:hypothetical protein
MTKPTKLKLEGKLLCALKAWHITSYSTPIWNAERASGISVMTVHEVPFFVTVDQGSVNKPLLLHCRDGQELID